MGRIANDGRGRLGGRTKGTTNKPQKPLTLWVADIVNQSRKGIEEVLKTPSTPEASNLFSALLVVAALENLNNTLQDLHNRVAL